MKIKLKLLLLLTIAGMVNMHALPQPWESVGRSENILKRSKRRIIYGPSSECSEENYNYEPPATPSPATPAPATPSPATPAPATPAPPTPPPMIPAPGLPGTGQNVIGNTQSQSDTTNVIGDGNTNIQAAQVNPQIDLNVPVLNSVSQVGSGNGGSSGGGQGSAGGNQGAQGGVSNVIGNQQSQQITSNTVGDHNVNVNVVEANPQLSFTVQLLNTVQQIVKPKRRRPRPNNSGSQSPSAIAPQNSIGNTQSQSDTTNTVGDGNTNIKGAEVNPQIDLNVPVLNSVNQVASGNGGGSGGGQGSSGGSQGSSGGVSNIISNQQSQTITSNTFGDNNVNANIIQANPELEAAVQLLNTVQQIVGPVSPANGGSAPPGSGSQNPSAIAPQNSIGNTQSQSDTSNTVGDGNTNIKGAEVNPQIDLNVPVLNSVNQAASGNGGGSGGGQGSPGGNQGSPGGNQGSPGGNQGSSDGISNIIGNQQSQQIISNTFGDNNVNTNIVEADPELQVAVQLLNTVQQLVAPGSPVNSGIVPPGHSGSQSGAGSLLGDQGLLGGVGNVVGGVGNTVGGVGNAVGGVVTVVNGVGNAVGVVGNTVGGVGNVVGVVGNTVGGVGTIVGGVGNTVGGVVGVVDGVGNAVGGVGNTVGGVGNVVGGVGNTVGGVGNVVGGLLGGNKGTLGSVGDVLGGPSNQGSSGGNQGSPGGNQGSSGGISNIIGNQQSQQMTSNTVGDNNLNLNVLEANPELALTAQLLNTVQQLVAPGSPVNGGPVPPSSGSPSPSPAAPQNAIGGTQSQSDTSNVVGDGNTNIQVAEVDPQVAVDAPVLNSVSQSSSAGSGSPSGGQPSSGSNQGAVSGVSNVIRNEQTQQATSNTVGDNNVNLNVLEANPELSVLIQLLNTIQQLVRPGNPASANGNQPGSSSPSSMSPNSQNAIGNTQSQSDTSNVIGNDNTDIRVAEVSPQIDVGVPVLNRVSQSASGSGSRPGSGQNILGSNQGILGGASNIIGNSQSQQSTSNVVGDNNLNLNLIRASPQLSLAAQLLNTVQQVVGPVEPAHPNPPTPSPPTPSPPTPSPPTPSPPTPAPPTPSPPTPSPPTPSPPSTSPNPPTPPPRRCFRRYCRKWRKSLQYKCNHGRSNGPINN